MALKQSEKIKCVNQVVTNQYAIYEGDCIELIRGVPDASVHYGLHSPPFSGLYKFSNFDRDISNSEDGEFFEHYAFLIQELLRVTMPGRLHSVHVMQLPTSKNRDGAIGMRDFRGEVVRSYVDAGWIFHSEVCIWKDPVSAMTRTKSHRLLHKQMAKDATISGQGLADYVVTFRKPGENPERVEGMLTEFVGADGQLDLSREAYKRDTEGRDHSWPYEQWVSILIWQRYASPVWMDINQHRTLQYRGARDEKDEAHISPLQLDVIERCIDLWSMPGDVVLTPFLGIGSEVYGALERGRRAIGFELKPSYFKQAVKNIAAAQDNRLKVRDLFSMPGEVFNVHRDDTPALACIDFDRNWSNQKKASQQRHPEYHDTNRRNAMSLVTLAARELNAIGADEEFTSLITGTMEQFFDRYDSGAAVSIMLPSFIDKLQRCIAGQPLSPLTGDDGEWMEVGEHEGAPVYQNLRDSSVFKQMRNGTIEAYDIDTPGRPAITFPYLAPHAEVSFPIIEMPSGKGTTDDRPQEKA